MKKNTITAYLMILAAVLLLISCKTKETIARLPRPEKEFIKMDLNGNPWEANVPKNGILSSDQTDKKTMSISGGVYFIHNDTPVYAKQGFSLLFLDRKIGKQQVKYAIIEQIVEEIRSFSEGNPVRADFGTLYQQGEMICEEFVVDSTKDNWAEIVQQDENYKYIWGKFNLTMYKVRNCPAGGFPDTLRITNGEFYFEF